GTLLVPEVAVPLATYTGWNLRRKDVGAENMLASLMGSYIAFAKTKEERTKAGDPRESIEERYGKYETYLKQYLGACADLVRNRYMLAEDAERLRARAEARAETVRKLFPE